MSKTVRDIVAEQVLRYGQGQGLKGYIDNTCEHRRYVIFSNDIEVTITKSHDKAEHFIDVQRVIYPTCVGTVKLRKIERYTWAVKGGSKRIIADIIEVLNELL